MQKPAPSVTHRKRRWWVTPLEIVLIPVVIYLCIRIAAQPRLRDVPDLPEDKVAEQPRVQNTPDLRGGTIAEQARSQGMPDVSEDSGVIFCTWHSQVVAWVDSNGSHTREADELPLPDVRFHVMVSRGQVPEFELGDDRTDWKGETRFAVTLEDCPEAAFEIHPDVPAGMTLTTPASFRMDVRESGKTFEFGFAYLPGVATATPFSAGLECRTFPESPPSPYTEVRKILFAPDGAVWVTSADDRYHPSAARVDPVTGQWKRFTASDGPAYATPDIFSGPDGEIWIMGRDGALRVRDNTWLAFPPLPETRPPNSYLTMSFAGDGTLWLTDRHTLWHLDAGTGQVLDRFPFALKDPDINYPIFLFPAPDGSIWLPTAGVETIRLLPPGGQPEWLTYSTLGSSPGINPSPVYHSFEISAAPDGSLWFVDQDAVVHYDLKADRWVSYNGSTTDQRFNPDELRAIVMAQDGSIWIGGASGGRRPTVYHFTPKSANYPDDTWRKYDLRDELPQLADSSSWYDPVYDIAIAPDGAKWLATSEGLIRCVFAE